MSRAFESNALASCTVRIPWQVPNGCRPSGIFMMLYAILGTEECQVSQKHRTACMCVFVCVCVCM